MPTAAQGTGMDRARVQRQTLWVLASGTVLGGLGVGASLSVGALLLAEVSGNEAISGLASAVFNAGAALAGIPLARLASRAGRRRALVTGSVIAMIGAIVAIAATVIVNPALLILGIGMIGVSSAVQLLSRFTATDLAEPSQRARDLSLVVWSITVGAVVGPNLIAPGASVAGLLGLTPLAGVFVFAFAAQALGAAVFVFGLRPDPLLFARTLPLQSAPQSDAGDAPPQVFDRRAQVLTIIAIALSQAIMVALMAMTPLHLMHHDGTPETVGITLSLHIAGMYACAPVFGFLAVRFGRLATVYLGWAILLVSVVLAFVSGSSHLVVQISLTLLGLGWSAITVAGAALITDLTAPGERITRQGQADATMSAAGALGGALSGVVFAWGDFALLAGASGLLLGIGVTVSIQLTVRRRRMMRAV